MTTKTPWLRVAPTAAVAVLAAALVPVALAGRGSAHGSSGADPTLTLSSSSVAAGAPFTASGCGYTQGEPVNVTVDSPSAEYFFSASVDGSGCVFFGWWTSEAGQYTANTYQAGNGNKQVLLASASLSAT